MNSAQRLSEAFSTYAQLLYVYTKRTDTAFEVSVDAKLNTVSFLTDDLKAQTIGEGTKQLQKLLLLYAKSAYNVYRAGYTLSGTIDTTRGPTPTFCIDAITCINNSKNVNNLLQGEHVKIALNGLQQVAQQAKHVDAKKDSLKLILTAAHVGTLYALEDVIDADGRGTIAGIATTLEKALQAGYDGLRVYAMDTTYSCNINSENITDFI